MCYFSSLCPHCKTEQVSFYSVAESIISDRTFVVFMVCNHCKEGLCVTVKANEFHEVLGIAVKAQSPHVFNGSINSSATYAVVNMYPEPERLSTPEHISVNVKNYYLQGLDNLNRGNFDASGVMFRKALDVATKELEVKNGSLNARINELAEKQKITPAMREWAHAIRLDGNDAAHEEDPFSQETCEALKSFTELFLMYAFTLPLMLKERSAAKSK